jgi:predicted cupin superfamily sugar epimerase
MKTAEYWISRLQLLPHPEGGYYRETYRAEGVIQPPGYSGPRAFSTGIYFLLRNKDCSHFHRMKSDELWHFYDGSPLALHMIHPDGSHQKIAVGTDLDRNETPQAVIPANTWFGARVSEPNSFTLIGCTVAPGFDFADFELARREDLLRLYPNHKELIEQLT